MKTQILHLDPHDDVASVLDKLNWAKAERLVLVWPGRNRILTEKLDLRLIQRNALRHNAQIGLVTLDPDVQAHAASLNIPVFEDLDTLHEQYWPVFSLKPRITDRMQNDRPAELDDLRTKLPRRSGTSLPAPLRISLFALAVLVLLLTVAALIPSAELDVDPALQDHKETFVFLNLDSPDSEIAEVLRVDRIRVEGTLRIPTTGASSEPGEFAHGNVEFTNLGDEAVDIPAGTTIRVPGSDQIYFIIQTSVRLSAESGSSRSVEVVASEPGPSGNVGANRITAVDGPLGLLVSVVNSAPTTGGSIVARSAVSPSDMDRAQEQLNKQLLEQAQELIQANQLSSERLLPESLSIEDVLTEESDRQVGEIADTLELRMSVVASATVVDIVELKLHIMDFLTEESRADVRIVPGSLQIDSMTYDRNPNQGSDLDVAASYEVYKPVRAGELIDEIKGMRPDQALDLLKDQYPVDQFTIQLTPGWYPVLPFLQSQVTIRYPWETSS